MARCNQTSLSNLCSSESECPWCSPGFIAGVKCAVELGGQLQHCAASAGIEEERPWNPKESTLCHLLCPVAVEPRGLLLLLAEERGRRGWALMFWTVCEEGTSSLPRWGRRLDLIYSISSFFCLIVFVFDKVPKLVMFLYDSQMVCYYLLLSGFAVCMLEPSLNKTVHTDAIFKNLKFLKLWLWFSEMTSSTCTWLGSVTVKEWYGVSPPRRQYILPVQLLLIICWKK